MGLGSVVNAGTLLVILRRRGIYSPCAGWLKAILRIAIASLLMGGAVWWVQQGVDWTALRWTYRAAGVLGLVAGAAVLYFGALYALGWRVRDIRPA